MRLPAARAVRMRDDLNFFSIFFSQASRSRTAFFSLFFFLRERRRAAA
jgi:hypothetical protein